MFKAIILGLENTIFFSQISALQMDVFIVHGIIF